MNVSNVYARMVTLMLFGAPGLLTAQRTVASETTRSAAERRASEIFARRVTVNVERVSLERAVKAIAASADVMIQYRLPLLEAVDRPVTLHVRAEPLGTVLERVLAGRGLQAVSSGGNMVTLTPVEERTGFAQGAITGRVMNAKTKQPIVGATVFVDDAAKGILTGEDGSFRVTIPTGEHAVTVRAVGYVKQIRKISVTDTQATVLEFVLDPSASVLSEVVVTGTVVATERKAIPTPITVITAEELEKRNITRVEQLFRGEVPGVIALEKGTVSYANSGPGGMQRSQIYARGSASLDGGANPIKTYVDGVEMVDPSYLGTIDPKSIEKIEIITGPQAATIYGSGAMGGVMQIFTKKGRGQTKPEFTLNLRYGVLQNNFSDGKTPSHNHALLMTGGTGPEFSYSGSLSYDYTGQWQPALFNRMIGVSIGATHTRGPATVSGSVATTLGRNGTAGDGGSIIYGDLWLNTGSLIERENAENGTGVPGRAVSYISQQISTSSSQTLAFNVDYRPASIWQHHLTIGRSQTKFALDPLAPDFMYYADTLFKAQSSNGDRTSASYNMTLIPHFGPVTSTLTLGGDGSRGTGTTLRGCLTSQSGTTYYGCDQYSTVFVGKANEDKRWGGFGSAQVGFFDQLFFTLAVRGERNPNYGRAHRIDWTPTSGATYTLEYGDVSLKLLASYGRSTRPPTQDQRRLIIGRNSSADPSQYVQQLEAPDLTPEYSRGPQGGLELYFGNVGSVTVNRYVQKVTDLIQQVPADSFLQRRLADGSEYWYVQTQWQNVATVRQQGWEGTGTVNIGALALKGTYSWNTSQVRSIATRGYSAYEPGATFRFIPSHTGNVMASYARGGTSVVWNMNYVGQSLQGRGTTVQERLNDINRGRLRMYLPRRISGFDARVSPAYVKSDLAFSHRLTPWASATCNITNLGNSYASDVSELFPSLGRQTQIGVSIRYPQGR